MSRFFQTAILFLVTLALLAQRQFDFRGVINPPDQRIVIAVPDFRGDDKCQPLMKLFNETLWDDLDQSGYFRLVPKTSYPLAIPQLPSEIVNRDWTSPPVAAGYLAGGYAVVQGNLFRLRGWFSNLSLPNTAPLIDKPFGEDLDPAGARLAAHKFAAEILTSFGLKPLFGSHIYFVRESRPIPNRRTEIWMMDYDGANQRQVTHLDSSATQPAISPDGTLLAFADAGVPAIRVYSTRTFRDLGFRNRPNLSAVGAPSFTPDGKQLVFSQSDGHDFNIWIAAVDGTNQRRVTGPAGDAAEARVNPKNGGQMLFTSGRAGHPQIYRGNLDGLDIERLSSGIGEATNPSWHPNGQVFAYSATGGVGDNNRNIFALAIGSGQPLQVTLDAGRNEHPVWAPDGLHIVFDSTRSGPSQIWTMLADGTGVRQLTFQGSNSTPVWGD